MRVRCMSISRLAVRRPPGCLILRRVFTEISRAPSTTACTSSLVHTLLSSRLPATCSNAILERVLFWEATAYLDRMYAIRMARLPFLVRAAYPHIKACTVLAAQTIANVVKTSLGPMGLDKMLVDNIGVRSAFRTS